MGLQEEQQRAHEAWMERAELELLELQRNLPEKRSRGREVEEQRLHREHLEHEVGRGGWGHLWGWRAAMGAMGAWGADVGSKSCNGGNGGLGGGCRVKEPHWGHLWGPGGQI